MSFDSSVEFSLPNELPTAAIDPNEFHVSAPLARNQVAGESAVQRGFIPNLSLTDEELDEQEFENGGETKDRKKSARKKR